MHTMRNKCVSQIFESKNEFCHYCMVTKVDLPTCMSNAVTVEWEWKQEVK